MSRGFRGEQKEQVGKDDAFNEQVRQAQVALKKMGLDIDLSALSTRNQNKDRSFKSEENKKDVTYANKNSIFDTQLKELGMNLGIDQTNVGTANSRDLARAQTGLSAMQNAVSAQNQANLSTLSSGTSAAAIQDRDIDNGLVKYGVVANGKGPTEQTARGTMGAVLAGDTNGALQNLAQELVTIGAAQTILAPDKGDSPQAAKLKADGLKALRSIKKAGDPQAQVVMQAVSALLNSDPAAALAVAKAYQGTSPSARIILGENKAGR